MKRLITGLLAAGLTISLLTACGGEAGEKSRRPIVEAAVDTVTFTDLTADSPYWGAARYAVAVGAMEAPEGAFRPEAAATRGEAALAVWQLCGAPKGKGKTRFSDAKELPGVSWCDENGILADIPGSTFEAAAPVSRQEMVMMLHRAAVHLGYNAEPTTDLAAYLDGHKATDPKAVAWAVEKNIYPGLVKDTRLQPGVALSRLQLARTLVAFAALESADKTACALVKEFPAPVESAARGNHDAIQNLITSVAKKNGAVGVQVAVVEKGVLTDAYAYGWATKETDPMTVDHVIRLASISKVGIGLSAMLLQEAGTVSLDENISKYWGTTVQNPKHPDRPITIRHMLTHTSSIVNADSEVSRLYDDVRLNLEGAGFTRGIPGDIGYWNYNNYGYSVLGMTLELAADQHIDEILGEHLYRYMDMTAAYAPGDLDETVPLVNVYMGNGAIGRSIEEQKGMHVDPKPGGNGEFFAGVMTTSASDAAKMAALLANDGVYEGVRLLQASSVEQMETFNPTAVPDGFYQGLTIRYRPNLYGRQNIYYHTGSAYGVFNCFSYDPDTGDGIVVLTTGAAGIKDQYGIYEICAAINNHFYRLVAE